MECLNLIVGNTFPEQAIHRALDDVELVLDREVYEVGIDQDPVWGAQRRIVPKE
jgi:hypothetical protein